MGCTASRSADAVVDRRNISERRGPGRAEVYDPFDPRMERRRRGVDRESILTRRRFDIRSRDFLDLDQLRDEVNVLERMFERLLEFQVDTTPVTERNNALCPPASPRAIQHLPDIVVSDHDLEDNCNRECSICFLDFNVNDTVSRLPCGHFYHRECISEWLKKKCTCPICRWEIETDDELYEVERIERMKSRRIRIKDHELDRLCVGALQEIAGTKYSRDRNMLITAIKKLDHVDVI